MLGPGLDLVFR